MTDDAIHVRSLSHRLRYLPWLSLAAVLVGGFSTWSTVGSVALDGTEAPNDGWLVVILALPTFGWARMMRRSSWTGAIGATGVFGAALVMCGTALESWADNREVLGASVGYGLVLVVLASVVLATVAALRGVELVRDVIRSAPPEPAPERRS